MRTVPGKCKGTAYTSGRPFFLKDGDIADDEIETLTDEMTEMMTSMQERVKMVLFGRYR